MPRGQNAKPPLHYVRFGRPESDCWLWRGRAYGSGYGSYRGQGAHRYLYECFNGPIPDGLVIDHLCRVRNCVRPDHLQAVTVAENNRRSVPFRPESHPKQRFHAPEGDGDGGFDERLTCMTATFQGSTQKLGKNAIGKRGRSVLLPSWIQVGNGVNGGAVSLAAPRVCCDVPSDWRPGSTLPPSALSVFDIAESIAAFIRWTATDIAQKRAA